MREKFRKRWQSDTLTILISQALKLGLRLKIDKMGT